MIRNYFNLLDNEALTKFLGTEGFTEVKIEVFPDSGNFVVAARGERENGQAFWKPFHPKQRSMGKSTSFGGYGPPGVYIDSHIEERVSANEVTSMGVTVRPPDPNRSMRVTTGRVSNGIEPSYVYAPTIPLQVTPTIQIGDMHGSSDLEQTISDLIDERFPPEAEQRTLRDLADARNMINPLRTRRDYQAIGRQTFLVEDLPGDSLPIFEDPEDE